jgi:hypothetical protein
MDKSSSLTYRLADRAISSTYSMIPTTEQSATLVKEIAPPLPVFYDMVTLQQRAPITHSIARLAIDLAITETFTTFGWVSSNSHRPLQTADHCLGKAKALHFELLEHKTRVQPALLKPLDNHPESGELFSSSPLEQ